MMQRALYVAGVALAVTTLSACDNMPGRPKPGPEVPRPDQELSFQALYRDNCAGCHGAEGQKGPGTDLANPEYEALIDDATLRDVIAKGQKNTMMPGFATSAGGSLTDQQVDAILRGMRQHWSKGNVLEGLNAPPYKATKQGDPARGKQVYSMNCARCHGAPGGPPGPKGAILDGAFLTLISDQTIRTTAITGRPDLGMPDWRTQMKDRPMTDQDVTDVVSWLSSQRPTPAGQPSSTQPQAIAGTRPAK
jgi:cytochrome c oxidase cbb3-type subunit 3/ubiquinol-cytochrome c reductase cytochrome c subunit